MTLDLDKFLKHETYLARLATGELNSVMYPSLKETNDAINAIISEYDIITTKAQLNAITKAVNDQIESQKGWATVTANMDQIAIYEAGYQAQLMGAAFAAKFKVPTDSQIAKYVTGSIMSLQSGQRIDAGVWATFVQSNKDSQAKQVNSIIIDGYANGKSASEMRKSVDQLYHGVKNNAESLVRTGYAHYTSQARERMYQDNTDILKEYYYIVTFDNRTSDICINADLRWNKKRFKVGDNAPNTPLHFQCRTVRVMVPEDWDPRGDRLALGSKDGEAAEKSFNRRRKNGVVKYSGRKDKVFKPEEIKANTGYDTWLKRQEPWFIEDTLGKKKAELFMSGKYKLSSFTDINGRSLTIDEVIARG